MTEEAVAEVEVVINLLVTVSGIMDVQRTTTATDTTTESTTITIISTAKEMDTITKTVSTIITTINIQPITTMRIDREDFCLNSDLTSPKLVLVSPIQLG